MKWLPTKVRSKFKLSNLAVTGFMSKITFSCDLALPLFLISLTCPLKIMLQTIIHILTPGETKVIPTSCHLAPLLLPSTWDTFHFGMLHSFVLLRLQLFFFKRSMRSALKGGVPRLQFKWHILTEVFLDYPAKEATHVLSHITIL